MLSVVTRPALSLAGMHVKTTMRNAHHDCSALWHEVFAPRMGELSAWCTGESYGVSWLLDEKTGEFEYWAAMPLPEEAPLPPGMDRTALPAGRYAMTPVPSLDALSAAYGQIVDVWLPSQQGYMPNAAAPSYEVYPPLYLKTGELFLYFPITAISIE